MAEGEISLEDIMSSLKFHKFSDGRQLAYRVVGADPRPGTVTVMYHHGTPSCHLEALALEEVAAKYNLRIVAMDRPGMGASGRRSGSNLSTVASDTLTLMDALGVPRAVQLGTSGGGPYAAATAALAPLRCAALVLVAALASTSGADRFMLRGMQGMDWAGLWLAKLPLGGLWSMNWLLKYMANNHGNLLLQHAPEGLSKTDGDFIKEDPRIRNMFIPCLQHTYRGGPRGIARDYRVLGTNWRVDFSPIACRTVIFQGDKDTTVPVAHAEWWQKKLPNSEVHIIPDEGHVTLLVRQADAILKAAREASTGSMRLSVGVPLQS